MIMLTLVPGLLCLHLRVNILDFIFKMQAKLSEYGKYVFVF